MSPFKGFPAGSLRFISIPDLFFTQVVPQIDNLAELKLVLHFLWLHARQGREAISRPDLLADETLMQSLRNIEEDAQQALDEGVSLAIEHGILLYSRIEQNGAKHDFYFLNSERGRQAQQKVESGEAKIIASTTQPVATQLNRPNIFRLYEDNIGLISPILADELREAELAYPPEWIEEAFKIAVENNARHWKYIRAVLERMKSSGRYGSDGKYAEGKPWYTDDEFKQFIQH